MVSQALTLYTTPVIYLYLERLSQWMSGGRAVHQIPPPEQQIAAE
jgi:HAE1 family hydrophobic/amphiphilic exporter-1